MQLPLRQNQILIREILLLNLTFLTILPVKELFNEEIQAILWPVFDQSRTNLHWTWYGGGMEKDW